MPAQILNVKLSLFHGQCFSPAFKLCLHLGQFPDGREAWIGILKDSFPIQYHAIAADAFDYHLIPLVWNLEVLFSSMQCFIIFPGQLRSWNWQFWDDWQLSGNGWRSLVSALAANFQTLAMKSSPALTNMLKTTFFLKVSIGIFLLDLSKSQWEKRLSEPTFNRKGF